MSRSPLGVATLLLVPLLGACSAPPTAPPAYTESGDGLPGPKIWSEAVIPFDANGDRLIDLLFVNANGWRRPGDMGAPSTDPLAPTLLINRSEVHGAPRFSDETSAFFPKDLLIHGKNAAVCDVDGDGHNDIAFAVAFGAQQRLLMWDPDTKRFVDGTERLPKLILNSNGVGWGDLDDDGDPDLVWVDSGPRSDRAPGGKARMLLNDGTGRFTEASEERFPAIEKISGQNAEVVDIDGDLDLDVIVDGKSPVTQLYINDGHANFRLDTTSIPEGERGCRTYDVDWADLDGDGDLDGVFMNFVGPQRRKLANVVLANRLTETGTLSFELVKDAFVGRNLEDENDFALVDADDDGDLDVVVAVLTSPPCEEKLFINQGDIKPGFLVELEAAFPVRHDGSLDITMVDVDGDGRYDAVTAQGESSRREDFRNRLYLATGPTDTTPPAISRVTSREGPARPGKPVPIRAWIQDATVDDGNTFVAAHLHWTITDANGETRGTSPMAHVGGCIHRAALPPATAGATFVYRVTARDPYGNKSASADRTLAVR